MRNHRDPNIRPGGRHPADAHTPRGFDPGFITRDTRRREFRPRTTSSRIGPQRTLFPLTLFLARRLTRSAELRRHRMNRASNLTVKRKISLIWRMDKSPGREADVPEKPDWPCEPIADRHGSSDRLPAGFLAWLFTTLQRREPGLTGFHRGFRRTPQGRGQGRWAYDR